MLSIERKHGLLQASLNIKCIIKSVGDDAHIVPSECRKSQNRALHQSLPCVKGGGSPKGETEGLPEKVLYLFDFCGKYKLFVLQSPSHFVPMAQNDSPLYTRGPWVLPKPIVFRYSEEPLERGSSGSAYSDKSVSNRSRIFLLCMTSFFSCKTKHCPLAPSA